MVKAVAFVLLGLAAPAVAAMTNEPTGFANLPFGTSLEQARKIFPNMEKTEQEEIAPTYSHPYIDRFRVANTKVEGLEKPVDAELRFWKGKFWQVVIPFGENDEQRVIDSVKEKYGASDSASKLHHHWKGKNVVATIDVKGKYYEVHDENLSNDVRQMWIQGQLRQGVPPDDTGSTGAKDEGSPPPVATPGP